MTTELRGVLRTDLRPPKRSRLGDRIRLAVQIFGELLITFGVAVLLFAVYELKITNLRTAAAQHGLEQQLDRAWATPPPPTPKGKPLPDPAVTPVGGQALAVLRIPRLGASYRQVVVEGVGRDDLQKGPGHYPGTALPGRIGNLVISGHRTTYGAPFGDVGALRPGDVVDIQVRYRTYHYRVTGSRIVDPDATGVLLPVPDHPGVPPTGRLLTFTTCNPKYSAAQRLIVDAEMRAGDVTDAAR